MPSGTPGRSPLKLEFPQSLATYDDYAAAQRSVDYLSDQKFPVEHLMIVGTDLKRVERITGRLTTGRVALGGALSGLWLGLFVGLIFTLFTTSNALATILSTVAFGAAVRADLGAGGVRRHPRPARLLLGHRGRRHPLRGPGRAQGRRRRPASCWPGSPARCRTPSPERRPAGRSRTVCRWTPASRVAHRGKRRLATYRDEPQQERRLLPSSRLRILPVAVIGRSFTISTRRGYL